MFNFFKKLFNKKESEKRENDNLIYRPNDENEYENEYGKREIDDVIYWQNAIYAVLAYINSENYNVIGGIVKSPEEAKNMQERLSRWWGVKNRKELLDTIEGLKEDGHNKEFVEIVEDFEIPKYMFKNDFIEERLNGVSNDFDELLVTMYDIWHKDRKNKFEPIIAWDLGRALYLCHAGYVADYFEYTEALDMALELALVLQSKFDSWDEFFENYLDGFQFWSQEFLSDENSNAYNRLEIYEYLKTVEDSPYSLDWNMELKKVW